MSKLNISIKTSNIENVLSDRNDVTVNYEGGIAFKNTPELQLYRMCCTSMFGEDKFYQSGEDHNNLLIDTLSIVKEQKYALQLANYVRNQMYLRTVPVVLLAEVAHIGREHLKMSGEHAGIPVRHYAPKILKRVDDCTELLAYWLDKYGKPIPNAIKRGIRDSLLNFDEYQLSKYRSEGKSVTLSDVVRLCARDLIKHERFKKLVDGELKSTGTWERNISEKGSSKESWEETLPRMGIMAVLRNLRNMIENDVDVDSIIAKFTDEAILKSKQLPFRWYTAWKVLQNYSNQNSDKYIIVDKLLSVLDNAIKISCGNIKKLDGITAIFVDHSSSMDSTLSDKGITTYFDTASVLGAISNHICEYAIVGLFGASFQPVRLAGNSIMSNVEQMYNTCVGHSTNAYLSVEWLLKHDIPVDRIIILTDMQVYDTKFDYSLAGLLIKYKRKHHNLRTYIVDMSGYADSCVPEDENGVTQIAGWSEKIFDFIHMNEENPDKIINMIVEKY